MALEHRGVFHGDGMRFAIVVSRTNEVITDRLRAGAVDCLERHGVEHEQVEVYWVPGSFEIPFLAAQLARSGRYAAVVGSALVVDGGVYRHDFVASTVVQALMDVQLQTGVPVICAVQAPHHFHEHVEHRKFLQQHFGTKGTEAAQAVLFTVAGLRGLDARA